MKKRRMVFEVDESEDEDLIKLEKQLSSIKKIRKNRLNRYEAEYKQKKQELAASQQQLEKDQDGVETAKQAFTDGKEALREEYLGKVGSLSSIHEWSGKEEELKKGVGKAVTTRDESEQKVTDNEKNVEDAKKEYQKVLLSIEKIDVYLEEIKNNT